PRWPLIRWMIVGAVGCLAASAVYHELGPRRAGEQQLAAIIAELDATDPGWQLADVEAARVAGPAEENTAPLIPSGFARLPKDLFGATLYEYLGGLPTDVQLNPEMADELTRRLDSVRAEVEEARRLAERPRGRFPIDYLPNTFNTLLPHLEAARAVAGLLTMDAPGWRTAVTAMPP